MSTFEQFNSTEPGGYRLYGRIGGGGQAEVFAGGNDARDDLAIKVISSPDDITSELFESEVGAMHALGGHPNIARVHYASGFSSRLTPAEKAQKAQPERYLFAVMDRALGTVADEIGQAKRRPLQRIPTHVATQYIMDIIAGVGHAHGERADGSRHPNGIVHRDIKPANALLFPPPEDGRPLQVKLSDFGIARRGYGHPLAITQTHIGAGTVSYADPRQFREGGALFLHDQYMTAACGLHIITGRTPFEEHEQDQNGLVYAHLNVEAPRRALTDANGDVDRKAEAVQEVLLPAMSKNTNGRYPSMTAFGNTIMAAIADAAAQDGRNQVVVDLARHQLGWRAPMDTEATAYIALNQYSARELTEVRTGLSRRRLLGGLAGVAATGTTGWWAIRDSSSKSAKEPHRPEASPTTFEQLLEAAFASKAPELAAFNAAEKAEATKSVDQVADSIAECLKKWEYSDQMVNLIAALGTHDPDSAFELWQWLETKGYPNGKEAGTTGLADPHAWAAASLASVKTDRLVEVLQSKEWADTARQTGVNTRTNDVRGANRGVLGCALARLVPQEVEKVLDGYYGSSPTAQGFNDALALALRPKRQDTAAKLRALGLEEAPATAATLAYKNPSVLMNEMSEYRDMWGIDPTLFGRALIHLLPKNPTFVADMIKSKSLDTDNTDFEHSATLEASLRCAPSDPQITEEIFKIRLKDASKSTQAIFALSLASYKPDIVKAVLADQPDNKLLRLALDPANETLRAEAVQALNTALAQDPRPLGNISFLAVAFICGQRRRLRR